MPLKCAYSIFYHTISWGGAASFISAHILDSEHWSVALSTHFVTVLLALWRWSILAHFDWLWLIKWSGTLFIFVYRYFTFKNLYFDINSTLLWIRNIVFHCLGHAMRCLCGHFWIVAAPRNLKFWHLRAVFNFNLSPENWTSLQKWAKMSGQKLVILPANENFIGAIMT
jgi:hypothetical protein